MSNRSTPENGSTAASNGAGRALLALLVAVVGLEALALIGATGWLLLELVIARPAALETAIALTVLVALLAVWLTASTIGLARRQSWARGSALTWQVLQAAVALGAVQGEFAQPMVALALILPAGAAIALIVARPVRERFAEN